MKPLKQAVILAAGASKRTYPLTIKRPKPLLPILNQPLLQHHLEQLDGLVEEVILIVGFEREQIRRTFGDKFKGLKLTYCVQAEQLGTGHALLQAKPFVRDRFFVLNGDDLIDRHDLERLAAYPYALLAQPVADPSPFNLLLTNENGEAIRIIEKPALFDRSKLSLVSIGMYLFQEEVFEALEKIKLSPRGEYEIVDIVENLPHGQHCKVVPVEKYWLPVGYPWKLLETNQFLLSRLPHPAPSLPSVTIKEPVLLSIGSGTTIAPGCVLGPNTIIGRHCHIAAGTTLSNCLLMDHVTIASGCHLEHTIVADGATVEAHTTTLSQAPAAQTVYSAIKGNPYDTARTTLGAVIGRNAKIGARCTLHPGVKIWPQVQIPAGSVVRKDVEQARTSC